MAILNILNQYNTTLTHVDLAGQQDISPKIISAIDSIAQTNRAGIRNLMPPIISRLEGDIPVNAGQEPPPVAVAAAGVNSHT
jgi:hypothetical protein